VNFNMSDQDYIKAAYAPNGAIVVDGILLSESMIQSLMSYFQVHAGQFSGEQSTSGYHGFDHDNYFVPLLKVEPEGQESYLVPERSLVLRKERTFESSYQNMNSVEFEWYKNELHFALNNITFSDDVMFYDFVLSGWDEVIKISTVRSLARFLRNLFRDTEFTYPFDALVNVISWGVLPTGSPLSIVALENRIPKIGDTFHLYGKAKNNFILSTKFVNKCSLIRTFLKYFSEVCFLRKGSRVIGRRTSPLFDAKALFNIFVQRCHV